MKDFIPTTINTILGTMSTTQFALNEQKVLAYVALGITIATTIFNFILDCRRKWRADEKKHEEEKDKKEEE